MKKSLYDIGNSFELLPFCRRTVMEIRDGEALWCWKRRSSASKVALFNEAVTSSAESVAASVGAQALQTYGAIAMRSGKNIVHIRSEHKTTEELIAELETISGVISAWPNYISRASLVPSDPKFNKQWGCDINAAEVWDITTGEAGIFVAVIDSGIDYARGSGRKHVAESLTGMKFPRGQQGCGSIDDRTRHLRCRNYRLPSKQRNRSNRVNWKPACS